MLIAYGNQHVGATQQSRCDAGHAWHAIDDAEHHAWYAPNGVHDGHGADARPRIGGLN